MNQRFQVRVPQKLRALFRGVTRVQKRFEDPALGRAWVAEKRLEIAKLLAGDRKTTERFTAGVEHALEVTFGEAFDDWVEARPRPLRARTKRWYWDFYNATLKIWEDVSLKTVTRARLIEHVAQRRKDGASPSTIAREVMIVKAVVKWGMEQGWAVDLTVLRVRPPEPVPRQQWRWDPDLVEEFLTAAGAKRDRAVLEVAAWSGMRAGELRAFDCSWIRWGEGRIEIPHDQEFSPKGKRSRSVPLHARLERVLKGWLGGRREGRVFPPITPGRSKGGVWCRGTGADLGKIVARVEKAADIDIGGIHTLRHHFASWLAMEGFSTREIQEILGHAGIPVMKHVSAQLLSRSRHLQF